MYDFDFRPRFRRKSCYVTLKANAALEAGRPEWENFRPWGDCLCRAAFFTKKITEVAQVFWSPPFQSKSYVLILTKPDLAIHSLGDFFTNSSGHPDWRSITNFHVLTRV
jgi:hypothetical protein